MIRAARVPFLLLFLAGVLISCEGGRRGAARVVSTPPTAAPALSAGTPPALPANPREPGDRLPSLVVPLETRPPYADPFDLARRLSGWTGGPVPPLTQPPRAAVGETRRFWVLDLDTPQPLEINAVLLAQSENADFWVQEGQRVSRADMERAAQDFERAVYPAVTASFGFPAPDNDGTPGRISVLHFNLRGAGGYFSGTDQLPRRLSPFSNEQQIVYLDLGAARPGESGYNGLLAHEFQHLVHQARNSNADTWLNEGFSEVASELLGGGNEFLRRFETAPDTQLNQWPADESSTLQYGAAHSFLRYLLRRYGGIERAQEISAVQDTAVNAIERFLRASGSGVGFLDVFADWTVANLIDEPGEGRFSQPGIEHRVRPSAIERLPAAGQGEGTVHQFGTRYLQFEPGGRDATLLLEGNTTVPRVEAAPASGRSFWWSNRADALDATLTREFDLTGVATATLRFKLWYDIERDYDFAYVLASRDEGQTWQTLRGRQTTLRDPLRNAFGPAYSGQSGGDGPRWVDEEIDLSAYAGERVRVRFEYVTDEASTLDGLAIDDISIVETGWFDDAERDGDWTASGFLRVSEPLPQRFLVQAVQETERGQVEIRRVELDAANRATLTIPRTDRKVTIVISGATLGTTELATFRWEIRR